MTDEPGNAPRRVRARMKSQPTPAGDRLRATFAKNFKAARLAAGHSQRRVGELTGTSQAIISAIEQGSWNWTSETLAKLSEAVGVPPQILLSPM